MRKFIRMKFFEKTQDIFKGKVDRDNGIIYGIKIATEGATGDGRYMTFDSLSKIKDIGNSFENGIKCRFGHPNACNTALGTYLGRYKNFTYNKEQKTVFADLYLDEVSKKSPSGDLYEYVLSMAESNNDMFGNSVVIDGDIYEYESAEAIKVNKFYGSDLVDEPAATSSLFQDSKDIGTKISVFLDENPDVLESFSNIQNVETFLTKYFNNMTIKDKLKKFFSLNFEKTIIAADGTELIIDIEPDAEVKVGDMTNAEDGEYILEDGTKIVVTDGKIAEINMPEQETEQQQEQEQETSTEESFEAKFTELNDKMQSYESKISELEEGINFLSEVVKNKFETKKENPTVEESEDKTKIKRKQK